MPQKRVPRGKPAPLELNHEEVQARLLAYCYGRLTAPEDAAVEAHVARCTLCRADGLRHIASERDHAVHQRAKTQRQPATRAVAVIISTGLVIMLGLSGFLVVSAAYEDDGFSMMGKHSAVATILPSPTVAPTNTPVALAAQTTIPAKNVTTLAWSPDGTQLATAAAPDAAKGYAGGVVVYKNIRASLAGGPIIYKRLYGFENLPPPGTLLWSPDGTLLAAAGHQHVIIWNVATGQLAASLTLPADPGTNLSVFDTSTAALMMNIPASLFLATGTAQWGQNGTIFAAPRGAAGLTGMPGPGSAIISLWGGQQGVRIFRDASGATMLGMGDEDGAQFAAFMRWSPDQRYLLWGYPRVPVSATLLSQQPTTPAPTAIGVPDAVFVGAVHHVAQSTNAAASVIVWPTSSASRLIMFDGTAAPAIFTLVDAASGAAIDTLDPHGKSNLLLNQVSCQDLNPLALAHVTNANAVIVDGVGA